MKKIRSNFSLDKILAGSQVVIDVYSLYGKCFVEDDFDADVVWLLDPVNGSKFSPDLGIKFTGTDGFSVE